MDKYEQEDLGLWESTEISSESQNVIWRFGSKGLYICREDGEFGVDLDTRVQTELALFNLIYFFWTVVAILVKGQSLKAEVWVTIRYHQRLHAATNASLLKSKDSKQHVTPPLLGPWLKRTLCLLNHDVDSRKKSMGIKFPSQLLDSTVTNIIARPQFQEYLKKIIAPLIGSEPFGWTKNTPSWCLLSLNSNDQSHPGQGSKGVFILPHEALEETWNIYMDMPNFKRTFGGCELGHDSITRLKPEGWLDDEVVNSYIALLPIMPDRPVVKVVNTWLYEKMLRTEAEDDAFKCFLVGKNSKQTVDKILAAFSKIVIPVNWNKNHWLTILLSSQDKLVTILDSKNTGEKGRQTIFKVLKAKIPLSDEWRQKEAEGLPRQENNFDCGVYCCQIIKYIYFGQPIPQWEAKDINEIRKMMVMEIFEGSLRWCSE